MTRHYAYVPNKRRPIRLAVILQEAVQGWLATYGTR
jgi:hypothetical protein